MGRIAVRQLDHCSDLQPTKECVETGCTGHEAPSIFVTLGGSKPSKKEEEVAEPHSIIGQMRLRRANLPERRPPTWRATTTRRIQVGVYVHRCVRIVLSARQVRKQISQSMARCAVRPCRLSRRGRYGERYRADPWQDGARNPAITRVEALSAEDDLHDFESSKLRADFAADGIHLGRHLMQKGISVRRWRYIWYRRGSLVNLLPDDRGAGIARPSP